MHFQQLRYLLSLVLLLTSPYAYTQEKDPFFQVLLDYAMISDAAYKDILSIKKTLQTQGYTLDEYNRLPGFGVSYLLASNDETKEQMIAVRGTSNIENTVVDAGFILIKDEKTGIDLHQGFALSARDIYSQIKRKIKADYTINITGHSLGGAVAVILAMYLDKDDYTLGNIITFGQPKVTNISGSKQFQDLPLYRVVTAKDMVPLVPPSDPMDLMNLSIFWHMGTEILLLEGKKYSELTGMKSMMRALEFVDDIPSTDNISNHFMNFYLQRLKEKQLDPVKVPYEIKFKLPDWLGISEN